MAKRTTASPLLVPFVEPFLKIAELLFCTCAYTRACLSLSPLLKRGVFMLKSRIGEVITLDYPCENLLLFLACVAWMVQLSTPNRRLVIGAIRQKAEFYRDISPFIFAVFYHSVGLVRYEVECVHVVLLYGEILGGSAMAILMI